MDELDPHTELVGRLDELTDLFRRRLLDDKEKRRALDLLHERVLVSEGLVSGSFLEPMIVDLALLFDRLDAYDGEDGGFVSSVVAELEEALRRRGVLSIVPERGTDFDPAVHEAIEASADRESSDWVVAEARKRGFAIGDRIVRPASVVVRSRASDPSIIQADGSQES